jgi:hypothetical protein
LSPAVPPTSTQMLARLLGNAKASTRLGGVVLGCVLLTLIILAFSVWPLIRLRAKTDSAVADTRSDAKFLTEFDNATDGDLAQIEGRSLFALPRPPSPREETAQKPDSSKPTRYGGPSVIAMVNGSVWFSDGQRLALGESGAGSLKVVSLDAPWSAKVEWMGGEFDVEFFQRSPLLMPASAAAATSGRDAERPPERTPRRRNSAAGRTSRSSQPPASAPGAAPSSAPMPPPPNGEPAPHEPEPPMSDPGFEPDTPDPAPSEPAPPPAIPPGSPPVPPATDPTPEPSPAPQPAPTDPEASRP